ncbi:hypothetical protein BST36_21130 [Mycolicibacterium moriokaense]|uniref:LysR substrate-binding domain-containing protein n=2 Tax=Mycolicibacterium moriokaense TaxID=39691 RepID=A0AAD1H7Q5_9MYCO|nr:LysR substrate-binding domain-containing protein [Mycolicibacterium moriokaense]ORB19599.1 hypothetical protein BST36_21130 [Mycolicibacterium moriokaense]BBW99588.1 hypothetical protein MMOR_05250 [Mycolicibacterium moriokaense]
MLDDELTGRLSIGCYDAMSPSLLPQLLAELSRRYPELHVDPVSATQDELVAALTDGRVELALLFDIDLPANLHLDVVYQSNPHALLPVAHALAAKASISLRDLVAEPLIVLTTPPAPKMLERVLQSAELSLTPRYELGNFDLIRAMVHRGLGYSLFAPPVGHSPAHWNDQVKAVPIREKLRTAPVVVARVAGVRLTRRAQVFRDLCLTNRASISGANSPEDVAQP